jgi:murein DD-endopeptidase MepM/ murein hydrolase activator NlpD
MTNPVPGYHITYPYGSKNDRYAAGYHTGDDYFAPQGTDIVATASGKVEVVGYSTLWGDAYGAVVVIKVGSVKCLYAHTSKQFVHVGQRVKGGQKIAEVGSTGTNSTGPHLHYEERLFPWLYANKDRKPKLQDEELPVTKEEMQQVVQMLLGTELWPKAPAGDTRNGVTVATALRRSYLGHDVQDEV